MSDALLIRTDADARIGMGHLMRCLALAQQWRRRGGEVLLATRSLSETVRDKAGAAGVQALELDANDMVGDATLFASLARDREAAAVVVDGYHFDAGYQRRIRDSGFRQLFVDDIGHGSPYCAEFVLNQNASASSALYERREPWTQLLLGTRYVLLREDFRPWREPERTVPDRGGNVLVTMGGSDPSNVTSGLIEALGGDGALDITVVVGGSNPRWSELRSHANRLGSRIHLVREPGNLPELMAQSDLAISAGGTTVWELAFLGVPMLLLTLAENQAGNVQALAASGIARSLGSPETGLPGIRAAVLDLLKDAKARADMSRRGRALVDGEGSFRVWLRLHESRIRLRPVSDEDCRLIWEWANEPGVRAVSFSHEPIPWETHVDWFRAKRVDPGCEMWIAHNAGGELLGLTRFDIRDGTGVISVSLDIGQRGRGLGSLLVWSACRRLFRTRTVDKVRAFVKRENLASARTFLKAGFRQAGTIEMNGAVASIFEWLKEEAQRP